MNLAGALTGPFTSVGAGAGGGGGARLPSGPARPGCSRLRVSVACGCDALGAAPSHFVIARASWLRLVTPSFSYTARSWFAMVRGNTCRSSAIRWEIAPAARDIARDLELDGGERLDGRAARPGVDGQHAHLATGDRDVEPFHPQGISEDRARNRRAASRGASSGCSSRTRTRSPRGDRAQRRCPCWSRRARGT